MRLLQKLGLHLRCDELLQRIVVDVVGDPRSLFLLRVNDVRQEPPSLFVDLLEIRDRFVELLGAGGDGLLETSVVRDQLSLQPLDLVELLFALLGEPAVVQREPRMGGVLRQHRDLPVAHGV
jgi:hypothetical protein